MKVLILFAHPAFQKSRSNRFMVKDLDKIEGVTFHDLYESYPDYNIDIEYEKKLCENHDVIICDDVEKTAHSELVRSIPTIVIYQVHAGNMLQNL